RLCSEPEVPRCLRVSGTCKLAKIPRSEVETASAIGTPEFSCNANYKLFVRNIVQNHKTRTLKPLRKIVGNFVAGLPLRSSDGHQQPHNPKFVEVRAQKTPIDDKRRGIDADFVGRTDVVRRQELVDP